MAGHLEHDGEFGGECALVMGGECSGGNGIKNEVSLDDWRCGALETWLKGEAASSISSPTWTSEC